MKASSPEIEHQQNDFELELSPQWDVNECYLHLIPSDNDNVLVGSISLRVFYKDLMLYAWSSSIT